MDGIASAVVLPDQDADSPPSPTGTKRRQSSISEYGVKRARLDGDVSHTDRRESISSAKAPAPAPKGRERGRERRLFGAALGVLAQNSATAAQKRRSEIEKRQQAQRKIEEEESEQRKQERQARRKAQRWREHRQFEEDSMRIRHDNLLAMAHFFVTTTEPPLYYKPWETTPEEDERIRDQIAKARDMIRREQEAYQLALQQDDRRELFAKRERLGLYTGGNAEDTHSGKERNAETPPKSAPVQSPPLAIGAPTNGSQTSPTNPEQKDDHADALVNEATSGEPVLGANMTAGLQETGTDVGKEAMDGEEVVEAAEDTVIY